jgi:hypothetical protein
MANISIRFMMNTRQVKGTDMFFRNIGEILQKYTASGLFAVAMIISELTQA